MRRFMKLTGGEEVRAGARALVAAWALLLTLGAAGAGYEAAWAGSTERLGTVGATELQIGVGPRSNALGGTTVAEVSGPEALFWNPAGLATVKGTQAYFSHLTYIAGMNVNYFAVTTAAGSAGQLGFTVKALDVGDVIVTTEAAPDGTGEILSPTFSVLGVTYARQFTDRVRFGATGQFVNEKVLNTSAKGFAVDLGIQYDAGYNGLTFGATMKNIGPAMSFSGSDFEVNLPAPDTEPGSANRTFTVTSAAFEMPSYFQFGAGYDLYNANESRLRVLGAFTSNNFTPDDLRSGAEYSYRDIFALRAGYGRFVSDDERDLYTGFSFGAGLNVKVGASKLHFDYANRMVQEFFDSTHEFSLRFLF
jgi:hypothetical protein